LGQVENPWYPQRQQVGWLLVRELISGHHDNEVAAAEDKADIREA